MLACLTLSFSMQAQDIKTDSISIIKQLDAMVASWNITLRSWKINSFEMPDGELYPQKVMKFLHCSPA